MRGALDLKTFQSIIWVEVVINTTTTASFNLIFPIRTTA
jgi:hypothetical protein